MPVQVEGFRLCSRDSYSTYPQNIAYKAAQISKPEFATRYLRRMRKANAAEGKETGRREVLIELASSAGLDLERFLKALDDGSAEKAFYADLATTARYGVSSISRQERHFLILFPVTSEKKCLRPG